MRLLDGAGFVHIKLDGRNKSGWPDRLILLSAGQAIFVELKRPGEVPSDLQKYIHDNLRKLGYPVIVNDNATVAFKLLLQYAGLPRE